MSVRDARPCQRQGCTREAKDDLGFRLSCGHVQVLTLCPVCYEQLRHDAATVEGAA
jgi:hypothetical protein